MTEELMNTIYTEQQRIDYAREYREWKAAGKSMKAYAINKGILPVVLHYSSGFFQTSYYPDFCSCKTK
jgi:hypothetical protein